MSQRPPRDLDWVPDDSTGINVPSQTKQNAGWLVEKPARQFFNWMWNRLSRWTHYFSGQSQEWIVIDSANVNEKDYDTLEAYLADLPVIDDKVLVKDSQVLTSQMIIPDGITLRILDGVSFTKSTLEANSVIKFGSDIIIEGILNLVLSHTGTTAKAVEFNGYNVVGEINVKNFSTGTLTTAYHINGGNTGNNVRGLASNDGGGTLTNVLIDSSAKDTNLLEVVDVPGSAIARALGKNTLFSGFKFKLGSDANGDIYYRDGGILKRLPKGLSGDIIQLSNGIPSWSNVLTEFRLNNWTERSNPKNFVLDSIEWDGSQFCAVGSTDGVDAYIVTSPDGITWTERSNPGNDSLFGIEWNGSQFCAVGNPDVTDAYMITSPDGITWTERSNPQNAALKDIIWDGSQFCAVGVADGTDAYIVTSPDGITWTERSNPKNKTLNGIDWNGSQFCAVGVADGTDAYIVTSPDGITWTERSNPKNFDLEAIVWDGSQFCAVGDADGTDAYIVTSPDGIIWTERSNPKDFGLRDIAWDDSVFCAVGNPDGTDAYMITSPDGITWTERSNQRNDFLLGIIWDGSQFCAVGDADGTDAYIVTSFK